MLTISGLLGGSSAYAEQADKPKGCPLEIAVQQVDAFVRNRARDFANKTTSILDEMGALTSKASKPDVSIGEQLSTKDLDRFNQLRHIKILLDAERLKIAEYQRDVHVINDTYKVAELADLYETKMEDLGDADPRRFYFMIFVGLKMAQPRTTRTPLISVGIEYDPEVGLFFEEEFNQRQLAKVGADQRLVNLVFDIERLRTLYQLSWNLVNKGIDDLRATTWKGDISNSPDTVSPMIASSSAAVQNMYQTIVPYIDKQFPPEMVFEARFIAKQREHAEQDYPVKRK